MSVFMHAKRWRELNEENCDASTFVCEHMYLYMVLRARMYINTSMYLWLYVQSTCITRMVIISITHSSACALNWSSNRNSMNSFRIHARWWHRKFIFIISLEALLMPIKQLIDCGLLIFRIWYLLIIEKHKNQFLTFENWMKVWTVGQNDRSRIV